MPGKQPTKAHLLQELAALRQQLAELTAAQGTPQPTKDTLPQSERYFRLLLEQMSDMVMVVQPDGLLRYESPSVHRVLGYEPAERFGHSLFPFLHPEDLPSFRTALRQAEQHSRSILFPEFRARHQNGTWHTLEATGTAYVEEDGERVILIMARDITERKQHEATLRRLSNALTMASDNIVITDLTGTIIEVNAAALRMYGTEDPQDLLGQSAFALLAPEDRGKGLAGMHEVLATGAVTNREYRVRKKDGSDIVVEMSVALLKDGQDQPVGFVGVSRDITARKQAEQARQALLQTLQARVKELTTLHHVARVLHDPQPSLAAVLQALIEVLPAAWQHPELAAVRLRVGEQEAATPDFAATPWCQRAAFITSSGTPGTLEVAYQRPPQAKGEPFMAEEQQLLDSVADLLRLFVDRLEREAALRESEARYRDLFENATDIIYTHDLQGYFTSINRAAERVSGYTRDEALQMHISQVVVPEHLALANQTTARQLAGETPPPYELEILTKAGQRVTLELHTRLMTQEGRPIGIQGIARDITERKQAAEALRQAKDAAEAANRAKSEFLATMSHELRTPLAVILGYTAILLEEGEHYAAAERVEAVRRIDRSAHELLDLITAVLDLSRLEAGRLPVEVQTVNVPTLLRALEHDTQELRKQSGLAFVWQVNEPLPCLQTDPGKLKVVLKNLIGNAVKFTPQGQVTITAAAAGDGVEVKVKDTGIGIPEEEQQAVFAPFHQLENARAAQHGGTGLGLYIVKRLLEVLGGTITVSSAVGQGSTFRVWVPVRHPSAGAGERAPFTPSPKPLPEPP